MIGRDAAEVHAAAHLRMQADANATAAELRAARQRIAKQRAALREANLAQRELIARMRAAVADDRHPDGDGMDWIRPVVAEAGIWPPHDQSGQDVYDAEMAEQRRLRAAWAEEEAPDVASLWAGEAAGEAGSG